MFFELCSMTTMALLIIFNVYQSPNEKPLPQEDITKHMTEVGKNEYYKVQ